MAIQLRNKEPGYQYCIHYITKDAEEIYKTKSPTNFRQHLKSKHYIIINIAPGPI